MSQHYSFVPNPLCIFDDLQVNNGNMACNGARGDIVVFWQLSKLF